MSSFSLKTMIGFLFLIVGCNGGVLFGEPQGRMIKSSDTPAMVNGTNGTEQIIPGNKTSQKSQDPVKPSVKFIKAPKQEYIFGVNIQISFQIIKGDNDIDQVICSVDGQVIPCNSATNLNYQVNVKPDESVPGDSVGGGEDRTSSQEDPPLGGTINLGEMDPGEHKLGIEVRDKEGNVSKIEENMSVHEQFKMQEQTVHVAERKNKIDILFIVDNSFSMMREQAKIDDGFSNFIDHLKGLDWRIGITTTDPNESKMFKDFSDTREGVNVITADFTGGRLARLYGGGFWDSQTKKYPYMTIHTEKAKKVLARNLKRSEISGMGPQGIHNTYRAIERSLANNTRENRLLNEFFRRDAALAVVVISDNDDVGSFTRNSPENLIAYVKKSFGEDKVFRFHSIVAHTQSCVNGDGRMYAYNYIKLSRLTGGIIGDICQDKYSNMLSKIGHELSILSTKTYEMSCVPQDTDNDGVVNFEVVSANSNTSIPEHTIVGSHVNFETELESGEYDLVYYCLN